MAGSCADPNRLLSRPQLSRPTLWATCSHDGMARAEARVAGWWAGAVVVVVAEESCPAAVCSCVCGHRQCHSCAALQQVSAVHELHQPWEGISPEVSILCQLFSPLVAYLMQEKSKERLAQQISKLPLTCSPEGAWILLTTSRGDGCSLAVLRAAGGCPQGFPSPHCVSSLS